MCFHSKIGSITFFLKFAAKYVMALDLDSKPGDARAFGTDTDSRNAWFTVCSRQLFVTVSVSLDRFHLEHKTLPMFVGTSVP